MFIEVDNNQNVAAMSPTSDLDKIYTWVSTWGVHFNVVNFQEVHSSIHLFTWMLMVMLLINRPHTVICDDAKWASHMNKIYEKACSKNA